MVSPLSTRIAPLIPMALAFAALVIIGALVPAFERVVGLALPFFGIIALGFACGRLFDLPIGGLAWLNVLILYVALPALFFTLISRTPIAAFANWRFVACTVGATMTAFALAFATGMFATHRNVPESSIQALVGSYSNIGYMGPGLTLAALGPGATAPTALIFVADTIFLFAVLPALMSLSQSQSSGLRTLLLVLRRIVLHPLNISAAVGILGAAISFQPPLPVQKMLDLLSGAAAPCALFSLGVTVGLQPIRRIARELPPLLSIKLLIHPLIVLGYLTIAGPFDPVWTYAALLMAALPPALNVFVMASQYQVYVERASSAILFGTLASVVTLTALLWIVTHDGLHLLR